MKSIADKIRNLRLEKGYSQEYIADNMGVSISTLSCLETAPEQMKLSYLIKLADFYDIKLGKIFSEIEDEVLEKLSKISFSVNLPIDVNSQQLFLLAQELEIIEKQKYGSHYDRK